MTIKQLSENKLKITLDFSEFKAYNLDKSNITASSPEIKKFIVFAIRRARRETGFKTAGSNIKIESVQNDNGLELFITKLNKPQQIIKEIPKKNTHFKKNTTRPQNNSAAYVYFIFPAKKSLVEFLYAARYENFCCARLYIMEGKYYLKLPLKSRLYNHALEFSNPISSHNITLRLVKNGLLICHGEDFNKIL